MKLNSLNLIFCAIFTSHMQMHLFSAQDTSASSINTSQQKVANSGQGHPSLSQQQLARHHAMSCYACSTMDFENSADNPCRVMKHPYRLQSGQQQAHQFHHPQASMMNYGVQSQSQSSPAEASLPSSPLYEDSALGSQSDSTQSSQIEAQGHEPSVVGSNATLAKQNPMVHNVVAQQQQQQHGFYPHLHSRLQSANFIRSRPCAETENYCSIVSVVRIEFVNDTLFSKFWALERNCSKSCNIGCMTIGDKGTVRLRVCSHCCRTPNCNFGSGALTLLKHNPNKLILLMLAIHILVYTKLHNGAI